MKSGTDRAQPPRTCFECDAPVRTEWRDHTFTYGADESATKLTVSVPIETCSECGSGFLGHEAERLMHDAVCIYHGVLTPREVRTVRERHGLSRAAFAEISGLGEATLHRWENGIHLQNRANDRYLRLLASADNLRALQHSSALTETVARPWSPSFRVVTVEASLRVAQEAYRLRVAA